MKKILFLCVANSARSQMAEGLGRHLYGGRAKFQSAGYRPGTLNPYAVRVMKEFEVDISQGRSRSIETVEPGSFDTVIYLCAEEACPFPTPDGVARLHWPMPDPSSTLGSEEHILHAFRSTRDRIFMKLKGLEKTIPAG